MAAEDAFSRPEAVGERVVILGGGLVGIELGVFLAGLGRQVTILEMKETLSDGGNPVHALALSNEIKRHQIEVVTATQATEVTEEGVIGEYVGDAYTAPAVPTIQAAVLQSGSLGKAFVAEAQVGSRRLFRAESVVYATGREPDRAGVDALRFCAARFHEIGDCWCPRNILEATRTAYAVARDL
jgi:NADPH-dependent 2,4-dienoyl-CoA reductase/sulfur reductase-like enzyme